MDTKRNKYDFMHRWFEGHIPRWQALLSHLRDQKVRILEIGAFEGASTTWILEELCHHPESRLFSVDTFEGSPITRQCEQTKLILPVLEERFLANVKKTGQEDKLSYRRATSMEYLCELHREAVESFQFIYIDGSHRTFDVLADAVLAWPLLDRGGLMIFDDYQLGEPTGLRHPKTAIDAFLSCIRNEAEVLDLNLQAVIKKSV